MFMKNGKKKTHPILIVGISAMAFYGAYSMVCCMKDKAKMLTKVFKNKCKTQNNTENCTESEM